MTPKYSYEQLSGRESDQVLRLLTEGFSMNAYREYLQGALMSVAMDPMIRRELVLDIFGVSEDDFLLPERPFAARLVAKIDLAGSVNLFSDEVVNRTIQFGDAAPIIMLTMFCQDTYAASEVGSQHPMFSTIENNLAKVLPQE